MRLVESSTITQWCRCRGVADPNEPLDASHARASLKAISRTSHSVRRRAVARKLVASGPGEIAMLHLSGATAAPRGRR